MPEQAQGQLPALAADLRLNDDHLHSYLDLLAARFAAREGELQAFVPETGRSHQLRVACSSLGAPILGDLRYGARSALPGSELKSNRKAWPGSSLVLPPSIRPIRIFGPCKS